MSILHTINKSPFSHATIESCLQICGENDGILLLEDGVFGSLISAPCSDGLSSAVAAGVKIYALLDDVNARGLQNKIRDDIFLIDYNDFVQLSVEHNCVQSWY